MPQQSVIEQDYDTSNPSQEKRVRIIHERAPSPQQSGFQKVTPNVNLSSRQSSLFLGMLLIVGLLWADKIKNAWSALFSDKPSHSGLTVQNAEAVFLRLISLGFIMAMVIALGDTRLYPVAFGIVLIALVYVALNRQGAISTWVGLINSANKNIKGTSK